MLVGRLLRRHGDAVVASTTSRSAEPLPWAIQVPEQARMTGSSAVTRPLAGTLHLDAVAAPLVDVGLAVGDHDDVLAAQFAAQDGAQRLRRPGDLGLVARALFGLQFAHQARRSRAIGRNSGVSIAAAATGSRSRPSPRSSERIPASQPRQDSWAMITVISDTTAASPRRRQNR
jgi:hypothetical protein